MRILHVLLKQEVGLILLWLGHGSLGSSQTDISARAWKTPTVETLITENKNLYFSTFPAELKIQREMQIGASN